MINKIVRIVTLIIIIGSIQCCKESTPGVKQKEEFLFLDQMPSSLTINLTTESQLIQNGFIHDPSYKGNGRLYMLDKEVRDLYCYIDLNTTKLSIIKIWKLPSVWQDNGIKIGMSQEELILLLSKIKLPYYHSTSEYDDNIFVDRKELNYWFCFPKRDNEFAGETKNHLAFVVVKAIEKKQN